MHVGGQVIQEVSETAVNGRVHDMVVIVKHHNVLCCRSDQPIDEGGHPRPAVSAFRSVQIF
jgi:hypothetical protein